MLDQVRLKLLLHYDPVTGVFTWRTVSSKMSRAKVGAVAGYRRGSGYWVVRVDQVCYHAHNLAWLYVHGVFPNGILDHKDRNKINNSIDNLRIATHSQNMANIPHSGISYHKTSGLWLVRVQKDHKRHQVGYFKTESEACAAYILKKSELFGEFA